MGNLKIWTPETDLFSATGLVILFLIVSSCFVYHVTTLTNKPPPRPELKKKASSVDLISINFLKLSKLIDFVNFPDHPYYNFDVVSLAAPPFSTSAWNIHSQISRTVLTKAMTSITAVQILSIQLTWQEKIAAFNFDT